MPVQIYEDINAANVATGFTGQTDIPGFHVFRIEDTYPDTRQVMPPYSFRFYQIVLLENSGDASLDMNASAVGDLSNTLTFASPNHVLAWVRGKAQRGYIVYFKEDFLAYYPVFIQDEFPFFRLTEINFVRITRDHKAAITDALERLLLVFQAEHRYRIQKLQALLLVLLFECKQLYDLQEQTGRRIPAKQALVLRFLQFVDQHFLTYKTVESYAKLLAVSPDYLRQTLRVVAGKSAHDLIAERITIEAKKLLSYSDMSIGEISDYLGFAEQSHFGRFFRRRVGRSPLAWRQQQ